MKKVITFVGVVLSSAILSACSSCCNPPCGPCGPCATPCCAQPCPCPAPAPCGCAR